MDNERPQVETSVPSSFAAQEPNAGEPGAVAPIVEETPPTVLQEVTASTNVHAPAGKVVIAKEHLFPVLVAHYKLSALRAKLALARTMGRLNEAEANAAALKVRLHACLDEASKVSAAGDDVAKKLMELREGIQSLYGIDLSSCDIDEETGEVTPVENAPSSAQ